MVEAILASKPKKMLIIDDEQKLLLGLKAVMAREGYQVYTALNGAEGVQLAKDHLPDVIICDVMMPAPNGFQVKKILAGDSQTALIPFVFLTARTSTVDKVSGFNQGADDYVTKPFNVDELIARIQALLRRAEIERQKSIKDSEASLEKIRYSISSNLTHELRSSVGNIMASLDLAIREKFQGKTGDLDWYLATSLNSAQKQAMLISDLILLNDMDQGKINRFRKVIDLNFHFRDPIQKVLSRYASKNLKVQIIAQPETVIHAPEAEFAHAVSHLMDNACKFGFEGAKISILLGANGKGGCWLLIENEGPQIPTDLREKVFERYYQIYQGDTRPYGGLGLGLTIARGIAEACGGSVSILDSEVGCKVCLILPAAPADWKM